MASVLPLVLPDVMEGDNASVTFTAVLATGETLVSINIIDSRPNAGITVTGATFNGQYRDSFTLGAGALSARTRATGEIKSYSNFEALPPPPESDIFLFTPPSSLQTTYHYTVEVVYDYTPPVGPTPQETERRTYSVTLNQIVNGTYDRWAQQLRAYIAASGPYPK